jgi:exopolysaccharide biosynthesis polyprenyl glycosylphosphotransferase
MKATVAGASGPLVLTGLATAFGLATPVTIRFAAALIPAVVLGRVLAYGALRNIRRSGRRLRSAVIIGKGDVADRLRAALAGAPAQGLELVGHVDGQGDLDQVVRDTGANTMIVTWAGGDADLALRLRRITTRPLEIFVVPRLFELGSASGDARTQSCAGIPLTWLPRCDWRWEHVLVKRAFDLTVALVGLILSAPVSLLIAVAVKLTSPGPVLYRQVRVGNGGAEFEMLKFRSMRVATEAEFRQSGGGDPRVTGVGRIIRRLSLDELPQLWNVVRGDMSIVGPRPEQPYFVDECGLNVPGYHDRHRFKVGLTGWSQVNGLRGAGSSLTERANLDNYYIEHWSLWLDISIILRTLSAISKGS